MVPFQLKLGVGSMLSVVPYRNVQDNGKSGEECLNVRPSDSALSTLTLSIIMRTALRAGYYSEIRFGFVYTENPLFSLSLRGLQESE